MDLSHSQMSSDDGPARVAIHAPGGFGKTTIGCHFPTPIVMGAEKGIPRDLGFPVATIHPEKWIDCFDVVGSLVGDRHDNFTLVIDTVDWLEPLIHRFVCERDSERKTEMNPKSNKLISIEDYGYGKGYLVAEEEFRKFITVIDRLQAKRGMHVVMLMHSQTRTFKNPAGPDFDRWEPKCHARIAKVVEEWCENMLFGFFQIDAAKISEDKERNKSNPERARAKGVGGDTRIVGAQHSAMYDAKNRVGLPAEFELGQDIDGLIAALVGEDVKVHGRRAAVREVKREEAWAERQRRVDGDRTRDQAARNVDPPPRPREPEAPPADSHETHTRDARTWTEPKAPADRNDHPAPRDREPPSHANGNNTTRAGTDAGKRGNGGMLEARLGEARRAASKKGKAYLDRVNGWVTKAESDPDRINAIITQVEKDLNISIPNG
jgi:hypothetical protein